MRFDRRGIFAVLLAFLYPGLGHLYLRAWLRAVAWFLLAIVTAALVIPESAVQAFQTQGFAGLVSASESFGLQVTLSLLIVRGLNMLDAYLTAVRQASAREPTEEGNRCPACGKEIEDASLDFCPWCTTRFEKEDDDAATSR